MILEGRTITTLAELRDFCEAAIVAAKQDPAIVRVGPLDMRLITTRLPDDRVVYDVITTTSWELAT